MNGISVFVNIIPTFPTYIIRVTNGAVKQTQCEKKQIHEVKSGKIIMSTVEHTNVSNQLK